MKIILSIIFIFFIGKGFCQPNKEIKIRNEKGKTKIIHIYEVSEIVLLDGRKFWWMDSVIGNNIVISKYDFDSSKRLKAFISFDSIKTIKKERWINDGAYFAAPGLYYDFLCIRDIIRGNYKMALINFGKFVVWAVIGVGIETYWPHKKYHISEDKWRLQTY